MHTLNDLVTVFFTGVLFGIMATAICLMYVNHVLPKKIRRFRMKNKRRQAYDLPKLRRVK